jgi:hypothetical protein
MTATQEVWSEDSMEVPFSLDESKQTKALSIIKSGGNLPSPSHLRSELWNFPEGE